VKFSDVIGNESAKSRIKRFVDNNKIPHALLISGAPGIPKLAMAQATAQYIHCTNRTGGDSCGVCPSCIQHQTFNHADTFYSFPVVKTSTSDDYIEQWRKFMAEGVVENYEHWLTLLENDNAQPIIYAKESDAIIHKMSMMSYSSKFKVLIMWLPEKMNDECANKLLKMIEEPYADSIFILVSENSKALLPTIRSRCQEIELKKLTTDEIAGYLQNKYSIDPQEALALAAPVDGNIAEAEECMTLNSENKQFFKDFTQLMRMAYSRDMKGLKEWSEAVVLYKREKLRRFIKYACRMVRENFVYNLHTRGLNYLNKEEEQFSTRFAPFINENNVMQMIEELDKADSDIAGNANGKIVMFDFAIKVTILIKK
jgi:DNA polymerase III subunit delta'